MREKKITEQLMSVDAVVERLHELQSHYKAELDAPLGVCIVRDPDECMSVGLGGGEWVLCHTQMKAGFPVSQLCALGNPDLDGVAPFYFEQWTEFPKSALIPAAVAEAAIREWLASGDLTNSVHWVNE